MAFSGLSFLPSNLVQHHTGRSNIILLFGSKRLSPITISSSSSCRKLTRELKESANDYPGITTTCLRKRMLNLSILALILSLPISSSISNVVMAQDLELERYTDSKQGFTLLKPASWVKVSLSLSPLVELLCLCMYAKFFVYLVIFVFVGIFSKLIEIGFISTYSQICFYSERFNRGSVLDGIG